MTVSLDQQIVQWTSRMPASRTGPDYLPSPRPLIETLPAIYQEDDFSRRFTAGLDQVIAPVFEKLDCLEAYMDPLLAPPDFFEYLAGWIGAEIDRNWPEDRQRAFVQRAATLYVKQGTPEGLTELVTLLTEEQVEVTDSGGVTWSQTPGTRFPGTAESWVRVSIAAEDPSAVNVARVRSAIAAAAPVHVTQEVEVVRR